MSDLEAIAAVYAQVDNHLDETHGDKTAHGAGSINCLSVIIKIVH